MRVILIASLLSAGLVAGCGRDEKKTSGGLPPAPEWKADSTGMVPQGNLPPPAPPPGMAAGGQANPHGAMGGDPHAGLGIDPTDPHAGLDMGGGGGVDVAQLGLPPPDPNRPIDPSRYVKGVIKLDDGAKSRAKAGTPIFLVVKRADASGNPVGTPLAVEKLTWNNADLAFELTERQAMVAGTELTGDVVVTARYDQDGDAISKEPGDIVGEARVKLPADNVQVLLNTIL